MNCHAVRRVDLTILPGQFVALLGPNGAGKTILVEMIEGIQKPDRGGVFYNRVEVVQMALRQVRSQKLEGRTER